VADEHEKTGDDGRTARVEPLPIWFFVGLILGTYGLIILVAGLVGDERPTVLAEIRPALWWSAIMITAGAVLTAVGFLGHRRSQRKVDP